MTKYDAEAEFFKLPKGDMEAVCDFYNQLSKRDPQKFVEID